MRRRRKASWWMPLRPEEITVDQDHGIGPPMDAFAIEAEARYREMAHLDEPLEERVERMKTNRANTPLTLDTEGYQATPEELHLDTGESWWPIFKVQNPDWLKRDLDIAAFAGTYEPIRVGLEAMGVSLDAIALIAGLDLVELSIQHEHHIERGTE